MSYRSPLGQRYATRAMVANFSDRRRVLLWRDLWIALAEGQRELGLPVSEAQIRGLRAQREHIDWAKVAEHESQLRHDVMAHVRHFGELVGPDAERIIHLGATSCFVTDNAELVMIRDGLELLMDRLVRAVEQLRDFARAHRSLPTLAYTHFQPAQLTTVGKRACLWLQDLVFDMESIEHLARRVPFRGIKGTTGTQASFLALFDGDHEKVRALDRHVAHAMEFASTIAVSGQTYTRKIDTWVVSVLADLCDSAAKLATDLRLLAHEREVEEPFGTHQVGSSAMAYKRNPMRSERICGLSRFVRSLASSPRETHSTQWLERTLDDSANRRLVVTEAFLATDAVLNLLVDVTAGLVVNPAVIAANLADELPFMATENVIMRGVRAGHSRQDLHERIRSHSLAAAQRMKDEGVGNDLIGRLRADELLGSHVVDDALDPAQYVGRAPQQVDEFLNEVVDPLLDAHSSRRGRFKPDVRV